MALVVAVVAVLAAVAVPAPGARAAGETLQVSREVTAVPGGEGVALAATLSAAAAAPVTVRFLSLGGPARHDGSPSAQCTVAASDDTCTVVFAGTERGTSLVRAWIEGTDPDGDEARLANRSLPLDPAADCRLEDDPELLSNTCAADGTAAHPGAVAEPDATDVVEITWTSFTEARLDCDDAQPADGADTAYLNAAGDRTERYTCRVTTMGEPPLPVAGARVDGEFLGGDLDAGGDGGTEPGTPDLDDVCVTDSAGRCPPFEVHVPAPAVGASTICFWAEPGDADVPGAAVFDLAGRGIDGGGCDNELVDEPEANDVTDAVHLDVDVPRASRLDAAPEEQAHVPGRRFTVAAAVYDQFGAPYPGDTEVRVELFERSPLDADGNDPSRPDLTCQTGGFGKCSVLTPPQTALGTNLACVWFASDAPAPVMIGDHLGGSCDDEGPTDANADDGLPHPVTDRMDVVRFTIQSRPGVFTVDPGEQRQETAATLRVTGVNFHEGARIALSGGGVDVGVTRFGSSAALEADVHVARDAAPGPRDLTVTNPDGGSTTCVGCFRVVGQGYWMVASDGGIFAFGDAPFAGSTGDRALNQSIVGMAPTPSGAGYWLVASDGGVFNFGDAPFLGSAGSLSLNRPIVGMAASPSGRGYWLVASDGGIFSFGDARFYGSTGRLRLHSPIVGIAASPSGRGYWLVAADGGVFSFGDARFFGSGGGLRLNQPIVAMTPTGTAGGYWLVAADGGVFAYGDARFHGGTGAIALNRPITGMVTTASGGGYWLVAADGGVFSFGDARFLGSTGAVALNRPIVGLARR